MVRIAVVGVGEWGKNHARILSELGALGAICDIDGSKAKTFSEKYNVNSYTSVDEMLKNEKLGGAVISTPTSTHFTVAKQLMEHRVNVLVEEPMASSSMECEQMRTIAKRNNVILIAGSVERFNTAVNEVKNLISQKKYGDALMLEFRESGIASNIHEDVGVMYGASIQYIDTASYLFGNKPNIVFVRAGGANEAHEDFAAIILGFKNQKTAVITANWTASKKMRQFTAICTDAMITGDFITQEIRIDMDTLPRKESEEPLVLELKNFIGAVDENTKPLTSVDDAIATARVAEAALLSSKTGSPIYLDLR
jgi:UDP-N-acetylglucosamine 3-dehydrogenase